MERFKGIMLVIVAIIGIVLYSVAAIMQTLSSVIVFIFEGLTGGFDKSYLDYSYAIEAIEIAKAAVEFICDGCRYEE